MRSRTLIPCLLWISSLAPSLAVHLPRATLAPRAALPSGWAVAYACAVDSSSRVLASYSTTSNSLTTASCINQCASMGYTLAGTEYSTECYCANSYNGGTPATASTSDCNMSCGGDNTQTCGGSYRIQIYTKSASAPTLPTGWTTAVACAVDTSSRVLAGSSSTSTSNTPSFCIASCASKGYSLAGVEYSDECYCGSSYNGGTPAAAAASDCSMACTGNSAINCGGSYRIQIYQGPSSSSSSSSSSTSSTSTSSTSSSPSHSATPLPNGWSVAQACVVDSNTRVLAAYTTSSSSLTPNSCITICASKGYSLAGTEAANQCYCASSYGAAITTAPTTDCNSACPGDSTQTCGGNWRMQIYQSSAASSTTLPTGWTTAIACAVDTSSRVLAGSSSSSSSNTPSSCISSCASKGFSLAGVEYSNECYCANTYNGGTPATASTGDCNMACAGNSAINCGGSYRIQIYQGPTTSSSSSSSSTTPAPSSTPLPSGWSVAQACVVDSNTRVLAAYTTSSTSLTPNSCIAICASKGYTLAGTEDANQCYCASSYGAAITTAPATDCNQACAGAASQTCGGAWRMQVYASSAYSSTTPSGTAVPPVSTPAPPSSGGQKLVVSHHIVGNTYPYGQGDWANDIAMAKSKGVDAFALNFGSDNWEPGQLTNAYAAAQADGTFKMFLSFDMSSLSCSSTNDAATLRGYLNQYATSSAQQMYNGRALVSTFSGESCTFGQSSVSAGWDSVVRGSGVPSIYFIPAFFVDPATFKNYDIDGIFNWNGGWPMGPGGPSFSSDSTYISDNSGRYFMAAASPWFYTHYSSKNWWYGGDQWLYNSRWEQLIANRQSIDIVEIISWNDYGESHYTGPIEGAQPNSQAWVNGFDHTPWLNVGQYYTQAFKTGTWPTITSDKLYIWSRPHPANAQASNDPLGKPTGYNWTQDFLWAVVFATAPGSVTLTSGSNTQTFSIQAGITKLQLASSPGTIRGTLTRNGNVVADVAPSSSQFTYITNPTTYNYNAFVASN